MPNTSAFTKVKQKDTVSLTFLALVEAIPPSISIKKCSLDYVGAEQMPGFLIGVYGAHSKQQALVSAANWNKARHLQRGRSASGGSVLMVDVGYRVDNFALTRNQITARSLQETGWLHFERLSANFRDEIKAQWLEWIVRDFSRARAKALADVPLADIALQYPRYVMKMMRIMPHVTVALYPVRPLINPEVVLWAARVRYVKSRFSTPSVRYLDQVKVII